MSPYTMAIFVDSFFCYESMAYLPLLDCCEQYIYEHLCTKLFAGWLFFLRYDFNIQHRLASNSQGSSCLWLQWLVSQAWPPFQPVHFVFEMWFLSPCLFCFVVLFSLKIVSLNSFGCLGTHSVDQPGLRLRDPPASASWVLGSKACATMPHGYCF